MNKSKFTRILLLPTLLLIGQNLNAIILGPSYPPDGGTVDFSASGAGSPGDSGGRNFHFSNFTETSGWTDLYWGMDSNYLPEAALDGSLDSLSFTSFLGDTAIWSGTTDWTDASTSISYTVDIRFVATVSGLGGTPWQLSSSVPDLDPGAGAGMAVVVENSDGLDFSVNFQFLADIPTDGSGNFIALNDVMQPPSPGGQTQSSFGSAFYTTPVPEPSAFALIAGVLTFASILIRRR